MVAPAVARYDEFAEWYAQWIGDTPPLIAAQAGRIRVGATHRKLSTILNALLDAGLHAELFAEPPATVPAFLLWRCRRR